MPKYVLHYFDIAGRAEPLRLMFQQAGVDFEDHRVQFQEWPELKKNGKPTVSIMGEGRGVSLSQKSIQFSWDLFWFGLT